METSKMLPMEPVAAAALTRALSRQFIQAFITLDLQHGSPLSDSMACAAVGARGGRRLSAARISN